MPSLDEIEFDPRGDYADVWAAIREMELRRPRYERAKLGVVGAIRLATESARRLSEALRGLDG